MNHTTERNEANNSVGREQTQRHLQRLFDGLQVILLHTSVQNEKEHRRRYLRSRQRVLDRREVRYDLGARLLLGHARVLRWEVVTLEAKRASPHFRLLSHSLLN